MNRTLVFHTALQRALSPARVLLVATIMVFPALGLSFAPQLGLNLLQSGGTLGLVLGAGLIGQDVSSGVLQLLFARPVSRASYVFSRWLGVGALAAGAVVIQVALGAVVMALRGAPAPIGAVAGLALEQVLAAFGVAGVLALFSSFLPGIGDLMAWLVMTVAGGLLQMIGGVLQTIGGVARSAAVMRASEEWERFLSPTLKLQETFGGGRISWFHLTSYLSTVTLCLALAILILNRRELSYATE